MHTLEINGNSVKPTQEIHSPDVFISVPESGEQVGAAVVVVVVVVVVVTLKDYNFLSHKI